MNAIHKTKKVLAYMLVLALIIGMYAAMPITVSAANANALKTQIEGFDGGIYTSGSLVATVSGNIVTVTGYMDGVTNVLELNIDADTTVVWKAIYEGTANHPNSLISLSGVGLFEVTQDGSIRNNGRGFAISNDTSDCNIKVSGGVVRGEEGAISARGNISVSAGVVRTNGNGWVIAGYGQANTAVTISGGEVIGSNDATVIRAYNGTIVSINGGKVSGNGALGIAILVSGNSTVNVGGGEVSSTGAYTIGINTGTSGKTINVTNGLIINTGTRGNAIYISSSCKNFGVNISGGKVESIQNSAIYNEGEGTEITVSGGTVVAASQAAITVNGVDASVKVDGGFVFAYGTAITGVGNVINITNGGIPIISGSAVVCAVNPPALAPTYNAGDTTNLTVAPANARATWSKEGSQTGISYANSSNIGFYPINGITVNAKAVATPVATPSGGTYGSEQTVTLSSSTENAEIYYTIDGTVPISSSPRYTSAIKISVDTTLTAIAVRADMDSSEIMVEEYKFDVVGGGSINNFSKTLIYTPGQFSDVNENLWYGYNFQRTIANAYEYGLMAGYPEGTFRPVGNITLAEAITVATRVHSIYMTGNQLEYPPIPDAPWYQGNVNYAISEGIIKADDFNNYGRAATRGEMAYIFSRSIAVSEFTTQNTVNSLPDVGLGAPYYSAILLLYRAGVVGGDEGTGAFRLNDNINRAEAAAIISRVILPSERFSGRTYG